MTLQKTEKRYKKERIIFLKFERNSKSYRKTKNKIVKMFYCHECAIEFAEKEGYNLHVQSVHSRTKRKCKKKTKLRMVKIALKSSPKKKQYVILHTYYLYCFS